MKKINLALTLSLSLLISTITAIQVITYTWANPIGMFPTAPEPLTVTLLSPKNGTRCFQESILIAFSIQNPTLGGADSITYIIDGHNRGEVNGIVTSKEGERFKGFFDLVNYSATLDLSGLSDGWHKLTVTATGTSPYNPEGGMGAIFADVYGSGTVQFLFDMATPIIILLIQQNQTFTNPNVPLNFTLSEKADWIAYSLDGQPSIQIAGNTTLEGLPEGLHNVKVYATDTIGRKGNSETVYFTITQETEEIPEGQPEPFPPFVVTAVSAASLVAVAAGALVYFKKRKNPSE